MIDLAAHLYDCSNNRHVDFLLECLRDKTWHNLCTIPTRMGIPSIFTDLYYVYTRKQSSNTIHLVVEQGNDVWAAYVCVSVQGSTAEIMGGVAPAFSDRGMGLACYACLLDQIFSVKPGIQTIVTKTAQCHRTIQRINDVCGFRMVGSVPEGFYDQETGKRERLLRYELSREQHPTAFVLRLCTRFRVRIDRDALTQLKEIDG